MYFTTNYEKSFHTFNELIINVSKWVSNLSEFKKSALKKSLNHGSGPLNTSEKQKMYINAYGEIHQAKLQRAFEKLPLKVCFGAKLRNYSTYYKFEKHLDEWAKPYSCQIYIFVSSRYLTNSL